MNFKPSNFYIGIIDLFAILLPGTIATLMLFHFMEIDLASAVKIPTANSDLYVFLVFLLSAYLLGHFISQLSTYTKPVPYYEGWTYLNPDYLEVLGIFFSRLLGIQGGRFL